MNKKLYKSRGSVIYTWSVEWNNTSISTKSGRLNGKQIVTSLKPMKTKSNEEYAEKLINSKLNEGYVFTLDEVSFVKVDINGFPKFQKANKDLSKLKFPAYAQPKYNGVRASMSFEHFSITNDLFSDNKKQTVFKSKNGIYYNMPKIQSFVDNNLGSDFFKHEGVNLIYDGELYIHNTPLNIINSSCPYIKNNKVYNSSNNPDDVTFVIFDIFSDLPQNVRFDIINKKITEFGLEHLKTRASLLNRSSLHFSECVIVHDKQEAQELTDEYLKLGFEGSIIRTIDHSYQYGLRTNNLIKIKKYKKGIYKIVDIIPKEKEPETSLFILSDKEGVTFKSNPMGSYFQRKEYLDNKNKYIGKSVIVKYYELSGVKNIPFHSNVIEILN